MKTVFCNNVGTEVTPLGNPTINYDDMASQTSSNGATAKGAATELTDNERANESGVKPLGLPPSTI